MLSFSFFFHKDQQQFEDHKSSYNLPWFRFPVAHVLYAVTHSGYSNYPEPGFVWSRTSVCTHQCLLPSNVVLECLRWYWQKSVKIYPNYGYLWIFLSFIEFVLHFTTLFLFQMVVAGSSYFCRYQSLSHSLSHQNFGSYLVFGECRVTPHWSPIWWFINFENKLTQVCL